MGGRLSGVNRDLILGRCRSPVDARVYPEVEVVGRAGDGGAFGKGTFPDRIRRQAEAKRVGPRLLTQRR